MVEWEHTSLGKSTMAASVFFSTINLANKLKNKRRRQEQEFPLTPAMLNTLTAMSEEEKGEPLDSDEEDEDNNPFSNGMEESIGFVKRNDLSIGDLKEDDLILPSLDQTAAVDSDNVTTEEGLQWTPNASLAAPVNVSSSRKTTLKEEFSMNFVTELSSLLAFVPIQF